MALDRALLNLSRVVHDGGEVYLCYDPCPNVGRGARRYLASPIDELGMRAAIAQSCKQSSLLVQQAARPIFRSKQAPEHIPSDDVQNAVQQKGLSLERGADEMMTKNFAPKTLHPRRHRATTREGHPPRTRWTCHVQHVHAHVHVRC